MPMTSAALDQYGIAIRIGHHCAMPLMAFLSGAEHSRASLALYNTREEVDRLVVGLQRIHQLLASRARSRRYKRIPMANLPDKDKLVYFPGAGVTVGMNP